MPTSLKLKFYYKQPTKKIYKENYKMKKLRDLTDNEQIYLDIVLSNHNRNITTNNKLYCAYGCALTFKSDNHVTQDNYDKQQNYFTLKILEQLKETDIDIVNNYKYVKKDFKKSTSTSNYKDIKISKFTKDDLIFYEFDCIFFKLQFTIKDAIYLPSYINVSIIGMNWEQLTNINFKWKKYEIADDFYSEDVDEKFVLEHIEGFKTSIKQKQTTANKENI